MVNAMWKLFFEFTVVENKRERRNLEDVEGLQVSVQVWTSQIYACFSAKFG